MNQDSGQYPRGCEESRGHGNNLLPAALALPLPQVVIGHAQDRGKQPELFLFQFFQVVRRRRAAYVRRQRLHGLTDSVLILPELQDLRKTVLRLTFHQDGQDAVLALLFDEVFNFPHAPSALKVSGGANADQPLAAVQRVCDILPQVGRKR